jgi:hypothetical protein
MVVPFVTHTSCPKSTTWSQATINQVDAWYANLQAKTNASMKADLNQPKDPSSLTLWKAWQITLTMWQEFVDKFQVSGDLVGWLGWDHVLPCLHNSTSPFPPTPLPTLGLAGEWVPMDH